MVESQPHWQPDPELLAELRADFAAATATALAAGLLDWTLEAEEDSAPRTVTPSSPGQLAPAIAASLLLHGLLFAALVLAGLTVSTLSTRPEPMVTAVSINLLPLNPLRKSLAPVPEIAPAEESPTEPANALEPEPEPVTPAPAAPVSLPALSETVIPFVPPVPPVSPVPPAPDSGLEESTAPRVTPPSVLSMRQSIQQVTTERQARSWLYECNPLQADDELHPCAGTETPDYSAAERNTVYENLSPTREFSRAERSVQTVYGQTARVAGALDASAVPEALRDYVLGELEAGTSLYTNNGTSTSAQQRRLTDHSAAAQQAERVLGDSWVQGRSRELQQRKVTTP